MNVCFLSADTHDAVLLSLNEFEPRLWHEHVLSVNFQPFAGLWAREDPWMCHISIYLRNREKHFNFSCSRHVCNQFQCNSHYKNSREEVTSTISDRPESWANKHRHRAVMCLRTSQMHEYCSLSISVLVLQFCRSLWAGCCDYILNLTW